MAGTSAAAAGVLTVMRTSSEPALANARVWMAVAMASAVSVLVIDCTTTGPSLPIRTWLSSQRTTTWRVRRRCPGPTGMGSGWVIEGLSSPACAVIFQSG